MRQLPLSAGGFLRRGLDVLSPDRFSMTHSYSVFHSSNKYLGSGAVYSNMMRYEVSKPLSILARFDVFHQPAALAQSGGMFAGPRVLPSFQVVYRPLPQVQVHLGIQQFMSRYPVSQMYWDQGWGW